MFLQRSYGDRKNNQNTLRAQCSRNDRRINTAWTRYSHIERRRTSRTLCMHKTIAVPSRWDECAVGSPRGRHTSVVRSPTTPQDCHRHAHGSKWQRHDRQTLTWRLNRVLCDPTASLLRFYGAHAAIPRHFTYSISRLYKKFTALSCRSLCLKSVSV